MMTGWLLAHYSRSTMDRLDNPVRPCIGTRALQRIEMRPIAPILEMFRWRGTLMAERTARLPTACRISREEVR